MADGAGKGEAGTSALGSGAAGLRIATLDSGIGLRGLVTGGSWLVLKSEQCGCRRW